MLPVRDGAETLGAAVRSALVECGPQDEILVVDDGSRDDPARVLPADRRLHLLRGPPLGIASALERGRAACRGALIARLDADDEVLPGRLTAQWTRLAAEPRLGAVGGQVLLHRDGGPPPAGMARYMDWLNGLTGPGDIDRALLIESPLVHPAVTLRAEALTQVGGWRRGDLPEDYDLWLRLVRGGWTLGAVDRPVLRMSDRPERLTRTDPRYRRAAFEALKREHLARTRLREPLRLGLWGAGRTGRPWLRWLCQGGRRPEILVDPFARGSCQGLPIQAPQALVDAELDLLLVAVGAAGARELIRAELSRLRPDLREGEGWLALA